eukprot:1760745-Lingulodinium_polyedra.AAC.1
MLWLRQRFLLTMPNECLAAQGMPLMGYHNLCVFSSRDLRCAAGNVFNARVAMVFTFAALSNFTVKDSAETQPVDG